MDIGRYPNGLGQVTKYLICRYDPKELQNIERILLKRWQPSWKEGQNFILAKENKIKWIK